MCITLHRSWAKLCYSDRGARYGTVCLSSFAEQSNAIYGTLFIIIMITFKFFIHNYYCSSLYPQVQILCTYRIFAFSFPPAIMFHGKTNKGWKTGTVLFATLAKNLGWNRKSGSVRISFPGKVNVDSKLRFSEHWAQVVQRAHRVCRLIRCAFVSRDREFLCDMFVLYVRPILEFASEVWSPYEQFHEKVVQMSGRQR